MANFSVDQFRQTVFANGLARENRFEVVMPEVVTGGFPVSIMCESTSLPQMSVVTKQQRLFGPTYNRAATVDYGGAGLQMVFYVDREMKVKKYFDAWAHLCVASSKFTARYLKEYAFNLQILQLDEKENITYSVTLVEAFPTNIGPMQLAQGSNDTFHRLPVTITYRYWQTADINNSEPVYPDDISSGTTNTPKTLSLTDIINQRRNISPPAVREGPGFNNTGVDYRRIRELTSR
jgi:hypothetical protein